MSQVIKPFQIQSPQNTMRYSSIMLIPSIYGGNTGAWIWQPCELLSLIHITIPGTDLNTSHHWYQWVTWRINLSKLIANSLHTMMRIAHVNNWLSPNSVENYMSAIKLHRITYIPDSTFISELTTFSMMLYICLLRIFRLPCSWWVPAYLWNETGPATLVHGIWLLYRPVTARACITYYP